MGLADTFQGIVDLLPEDWTDLELDLRIVDESRYVEAALYLVTCNARPYSHHDWHWRLMVAHSFGHAAAAPTVHGTMKLLDEAGIEGELVLREVRSGRVEVVRRVGPPGVGPRGVPPPARPIAMARVLVLSADLMFGSRLHSALRRPGTRSSWSPTSSRCASGSATAPTPPSARWSSTSPTSAFAPRRCSTRCGPRADWAPCARWPSTPTWTCGHASARRGPASTSPCRARGWPARAPRCSRNWASERRLEADRCGDVSATRTLALRAARRA